MRLVQRYLNWRRERDLKEVERILGGLAAPARTVRQIAAGVEPWGQRVKDTLPVPNWNLGFMDWIFAGAVMMELLLQRR